MESNFCFFVALIRFQSFITASEPKTKSPRYSIKKEYNKEPRRERISGTTGAPVSRVMKLRMSATKPFKIAQPVDTVVIGEKYMRLS